MGNLWGLMCKAMASNITALMSQSLSLGSSTSPNNAYNLTNHKHTEPALEPCYWLSQNNPSLSERTALLLTFLSHLPDLPRTSKKSFCFPVFCTLSPWNYSSLHMGQNVALRSKWPRDINILVRSSSFIQNRNEILPV